MTPTGWKSGRYNLRCKGFRTIPPQTLPYLSQSTVFMEIVKKREMESFVNRKWCHQRHQSCDFHKEEVLLGRSDNTVTSARIFKKKTTVYHICTTTGNFNSIIVSTTLRGFIFGSFFPENSYRRVDRWLFTSSNDCRLTKLVLFRESKSWLPSTYATMFSYNLAAVIKVLCKHARCIWTCSYPWEVAVANRVHRYIW